MLVLLNCFVCIFHCHEYLKLSTHHTNFFYDSFWHKSAVLDDYVGMVESISSAHNVSYINMRREYLRDIPAFKGSFPGFSYTRLFIKAKYFVSREGTIIFLCDLNMQC